MSNCGSCRWWNHATTEYLAACIISRDDENVYLGVERANADPICGHCTSPRLLFSARPAAGEASVSDASGYKAVLVTSESFGCSNHEARD